MIFATFRLDIYCIEECQVSIAQALYIYTHTKKKRFIITDQDFITALCKYQYLLDGCSWLIRYVWSCDFFLMSHANERIKLMNLKKNLYINLMKHQIFENNSFSQIPLAQIFWTFKLLFSLTKIVEGDRSITQLLILISFSYSYLLTHQVSLLPLK
jgi:hypothetical protein